MKIDTELIRDEIINSGIPRKEICKNTGMSKDTLCRIEYGLCQFTQVKYFLKLINTLGLKVEEVVTNELP